MRVGPDVCEEGFAVANKFSVRRVERESGREKGERLVLILRRGALSPFLVSFAAIAITTTAIASMPCKRLLSTALINPRYTKTQTRHLENVGTAKPRADRHWRAAPVLFL